MTTGILTEDSELQPCLPEWNVTLLYWDIIFSKPFDILTVRPNTDFEQLQAQPTVCQLKRDYTPQGLQPVTTASCATSPVEQVWLVIAPRNTVWVNEAIQTEQCWWVPSAKQVHLDDISVFILIIL